MGKVNASALQIELCKSLCADVRTLERSDDRVAIVTPFSFPDGDALSIFAEPAAGGIRITDCGNTLMHLSYYMDVDDLGGGSRAEIFRSILADAGVKERNGALFIDTRSSAVADAVFRLSQAIMRVHDITFLTRHRVASTFYDDLAAQVSLILPSGGYQRKWLVPGHDDADKYPIDFRIDTAANRPPLFLFGVPSSVKAKLTTLILEHWLRAKIDFDSLIVFANQSKIPGDDLQRLTNVGGEMIASLAAREDMERKIRRKIIMITAN